MPWLPRYLTLRQRIERLEDWRHHMNQQLTDLNQALADLKTALADAVTRIDAKLADSPPTRRPPHRRLPQPPRSPRRPPGMAPSQRSPDFYQFSGTVP
jgi:hypothetical protein